MVVFVDCGLFLFLSANRRNKLFPYTRVPKGLDSQRYLTVSYTLVSTQPYNLPKRGENRNVTLESRGARGSSGSYSTFAPLSCKPATISFLVHARIEPIIILSMLEVHRFSSNL